LNWGSESAEGGASWAVAVMYQMLDNLVRNTSQFSVQDWLFTFAGLTALSLGYLIARRRSA
jgi:hypothetical protein